MKQYQETEHCSFTIDGMSIPAAAGNRHYRKMQEEVTAGEAEILPYVALPIDIIAEKAKAQNLIDEAATQARDRYRSANKDATYLNKSAELDRYIVAGRPDPVIENEYPYLYNEALETESTVTEIAQLIETTRAIWVPALDPVIEGKARGGKVKVENAQNSA